MKTLLLTITIVLFVAICALPQVTVSNSHASSNGTYSTLKAAFDAINAQSQTGRNITVSITNSTTETATASLTGAGGLWTTLTISPSGGTGRTISGDITGALISLDGATNVTIDGLNTGGNSLTISNTNSTTSASTISFVNGASNNTINKCSILGSTTEIAITVNGKGIILFGASTGATGNNNNTISYNNITHAGADANRPINAVYSFGSNGKDNTGNTIRNNNIYNFFRHGATSYGIHIRSFSTGYTISGNSFYETEPFASTVSSSTNYMIYINNTSGNNFTVSNNYIGGREANCNGSAWTKTDNLNYLICIYLSTSIDNGYTITGNTIKNIYWANENLGLFVIWSAAGSGTVSNNIIGANTGTGSITYKIEGSNSSGTFYGIYVVSSSNVVCENNTIGSITLLSNNSRPLSFIGIDMSVSSGGTLNNNTIGSTTTANSINASSTSTANTQNVRGIRTSGPIIISGNTIANMTNGTTYSSTGTSGLINGITHTSGNITIINNTIHDLTIANANTNALSSASATGIVFTATTASTQTISQNTIYNISNTRSDFAGSVIGLYYNGPSTASTVSRNFIHSLSVHSSTTNANIYGIRINAGNTTYSNNIIFLGGNTQTTLYGIYERGAASNNNSIYFNTVYISGIPTAGALNSYALYSNASTNIRDFRNNIFVNARSNNGATGKHYSAYFNYATDTDLTLNYNDYYASGTGGVLGYYNSEDISDLPLINGKDANSKNVNPQFASAGGTAPANYQTSDRTIVAEAGTGILIDYAGFTRDVTYPTMGAYENAVPLPVELISFTYTISVKNVNLNWQTATEVNNYGFEIQRAIVNVGQTISLPTWEKIGFVAGHGNSNSTKEYSFVDESISGGKYSYRLKQIDNDGGFSYSDEIIVETLHSARGGSSLPTEYSLEQNYPNPFNPSTTIKFGLPKDTRVMLEVYNIIGEKITTLVNKEMTAGYHQVNFKGSHLSSGIYFYNINVDGKFNSLKKMVIVK